MQLPQLPAEVIKFSFKIPPVNVQVFDTIWPNYNEIKLKMAGIATVEHSCLILDNNILFVTMRFCDTEDNISFLMLLQTSFDKKKTFFSRNNMFDELNSEIKGFNLNLSFSKNSNLLTGFFF